MIADYRGKKLLEFAQYSKDSATKMIKAMYRASEDGRLRLVWGEITPYLFIEPEVVWLNTFPQQIEVTANVLWTTS